MAWLGSYLAPSIRLSHWPQTGMCEITPGRSASIRQPHWYRLLAVKRPTRTVEELHQVAATRTERRLSVQVVSVTGVSRE